MVLQVEVLNSFGDGNINKKTAVWGYCPCNIGSVPNANVTGLPSGVLASISGNTTVPLALQLQMGVFLITMYKLSQKPVTQ